MKGSSIKNNPSRSSQSSGTSTTAPHQQNYRDVERQAQLDREAKRCPQDLHRSVKAQAGVNNDTVEGTHEEEAWFDSDVKMPYLPMPSGDGSDSRPSTTRASLNNDETNASGEAVARLVDRDSKQPRQAVKKPTVGPGGATGDNNPVVRALNRAARDGVMPLPPAGEQVLLHREESEPGAMSISGSPNHSRTNTHHDEERNSSAIQNDDGAHANARATTDLVTATVIPDAQLRAEYRQAFLEEAVQAEVLPCGQIISTLLEEREPPLWKRPRTIGIFVFLLLITVGVAVGAVAFATKGDGNNEHTVISLSTMERVRQRGHLVCGVDADENYISPDKMAGLLKEICHAIAAVVLDDHSKVEFVSMLDSNRFRLAGDGTMDVLAAPVTHNLGRDVREATSGVGLAFASTFFYAGLMFAGVQEYIECIDRLDVSTGVCRDVKLCAAHGTTHVAIIRQQMPAAGAVIEDSTSACIARFAAGDVNAVAGDYKVTLSEQRFRAAGYNDELFFTQNAFSREPNSIVTVDSDTEWTDLVNSVMDILYTAEGRNLTQEAAQSLLSSGEPLGDEWEGVDTVLTTLIMNVVATVGNYGEIYERTIQPAMQREGLNLLNNFENGRTGLMYSRPIGQNHYVMDETMDPGPTIAALRERGEVKCGVYERPAFADFNQTTEKWSGLDIELCKAVAAALFRTEEESLDIVSLDADTGFMALMDGSVDVLAGQAVTLTNKYSETSTGGLSFSFSEPYFYGSDGGAIGLATSREDTQFSDFVYWVVMGLVHAEEHQITSINATAMPVVNFFGDGRKQMFIDCVSRVGNYGEIYVRTLGSSIPRQGRNLLNTYDSGTGFGPQQFAVPVV